KTAPTYALLSAGPLFFMDMELEPEKKAQETSKAETIALATKALNLAAFAPSRNLWAAGEGEVQTLTDKSGAAMLAANLEGAPAQKRVVKPVGGPRLGIVGVAAPDKAEKVHTPLPKVTSSAAIPAVNAAVAALKKEGVQAIVVLASVGRGEAKRIA